MKQHDYCLDEETLKESMSERGRDMYKAAEQLINFSKAREAGLIYLKDSMVEIPIADFSSNSSTSTSTSNGSDLTLQSRRKSWKIWGSPWSAAFCSMAFNIPRGDSSAG